MKTAFSLKDYWLHGEGLAKWATWTELYDHLRKHVPAEYAKRIAAQWYHDRYGRWPGAHHGSRTAAAVNGHHVPETAYNWRHGWVPLNVATALLHGKKADAERLRAESGKHDTSIRGMSDAHLEQAMQDAIAREDYGHLDKLGAESDRREAALATRNAAKDATRIRREKEANARLDRMGALIDQGMSEADAHVEVFGGSREGFNRKQATAALRSQGYQGRSFDELSRQSYHDHVDAEYNRAEQDTNGVMLSREAESYNAGQGIFGRKIDPKDLFSGNEATARKHASKELRAWWDQNGRPTLQEWQASLLDDPQQARNLRARRGVMAASAHTFAEGDPMAAPPPEWFTDPGLDGPTALTVTEDGQVFGHIAAFGVPHVGLDDPTVAPRSTSGYRYFRTGAVLTSDGSQVPVGHLTLGTGHAALDAGVTAAAEHYDNTGTAVADVAVGEDEHGIWCAGAVRPGASAEQVHALRASPISGDWRAIDGQLELVAALAVNVPGFPVPRSVAAAGVQMALVAAGSVVAATPPPAKPPAKPAAKKAPAKKAPAGQQGGDFNSKHPRGAAGSSAGGQFVPLGTARSSAAAKAQQDPKAKAGYEVLLKAKPGDRAAQLKGLKDGDLEALSRITYSFKSSDPKVVAARIAIANELARRGKDVKNFGALGGGPARKPAVKKAPVKKTAVAAAAPRTTPPREDHSMSVTFTDEELAAMRTALGLDDDAGSDAITAALTAAMGDAESGEGEGEGDAVDETQDAVPALSASLPPGLVAIDSTQLAALRAAAQRGDEARTAQERDARQALVASAISDGRIPPARRDHWLKQLEADPGVSAVLASMAPGLIPVGSPIGHSGDGADSVADDLYASVFGKES